LPAPSLENESFQGFFRFVLIFIGWLLIFVILQYKKRGENDGLDLFFPLLGYYIWWVILFIQFEFPVLRT